MFPPPHETIDESRPAADGPHSIAPPWAPLKVCLALAVWCSLSGWLLSAFGSLNRLGYLSSAMLAAGVCGVWLRTRGGGKWAPHHAVWSRWQRRFTRPLPALFATTFALAALGGVLYPPNNFDALNYRLPQLLHWLDAARWHWIATANNHLNITSPGYTWLMAPLFTLTQSDRAFFLPNLVAYAFLPGLFFRVAHGCGIRRRVAWYWMWLIPSGYCFAMQAGGIANDLLPTAYLLAAVALAFRARHTGAAHDAWFSILAAALAAGVKVVVLPLGLPWLVSIAPAGRSLLRRPFGSASVILIALAISFLPSALLNTKYTGDWSGDPANVTGIRIDQPLYGLVGNALQLAATNLAPPVWPAPGAVNALFTHFEESAAGQAIRAHYPRFQMEWFELAGEDGTGLGLGIVVLVLVSLAASVVSRGTPATRPPLRLGYAVSLAAFIAAGAYAAKMGSEAAPRLIAAYYPFLLIPILLLPIQEILTRSRSWRILAWICAASILPALILTPARPLWPARTVLSHLLRNHPESAFLRRANLVYLTFAQRYDYLAPLRKFIPSNAFTVGFVPTGNDLEGTLWRPFGTRRVVEILQPTPSDPAIQQLAGSVIVCSPRGLDEHFHMTVDAFSAAVGGRLIGEEILTLKAVIGPEKWCVIAL